MRKSDKNWNFITRCTSKTKSTCTSRTTIGTKTDKNFTICNKSKFQVCHCTIWISIQFSDASKIAIENSNATIHRITEEHMCTTARGAGDFKICNGVANKCFSIKEFELTRCARVLRESG